MGIRLVVVYRRLNGHDPAFHTVCKVDISAFEGQPEEEIQKALKTLINRNIQAFVKRYPEFEEADFYSTDLFEAQIPTVVL